MAGIKAEELIETVRMFPALYDQAQEQYRNSEYKDIMWKKVAKKLNVEGQEEECKKKWNGIRDSLRRARQKRKTKSGQAAISSNKYKFETILEFLIPHLAERKGIGNVPDEAEENNETQPTDDPQMQNLNNDINADINEYVSDGTAESESLLPPRTPSASRVSIDNRTPSAKRKRKLPHTEMKPGESASSQLMAYLLAEKEAEKKKKPSDNDEQHPIDVFLSGIAASLKSLDPLRLHSAKGKIFNIVQEYELEQLRELDSYIRPTRLMDQQFGLCLDHDDLLAPVVEPGHMLTHLRGPVGCIRPWRTSASQRDVGSTLAIDEDNFKANLDVQQFKPDEITVKVTGNNTITIEGKHEEKQDEHGFISRQFVRRYVLPQDCDIDKIESKLSSDGILTITAPRCKPEDPENKTIPITQTGQPAQIEKKQEEKEEKK